MGRKKEWNMNGKKPTYLGLIFFSILTILLGSCNRATTPDETPTAVPVTSAPISGEEIREDAMVERVEVLILESFPVQVSVQISGSLPDSCTEVVSTNVEQQGQRYLVLITTARPADKECAQVIRPFTETVSLDVLGRPAGDYQVLVNGVEFQL